jgi:hypothetical protein
MEEKKKISVEDLLKIEYNELGLTKPEIDILKLKHSNKKHINWMTKHNDKYTWTRKKRMLVD